MRRREFVILLGTSPTWPLAALAQQSTKVTRIGFLSPVSASNRAIYVEGFRAGLRDLGYVEGKNIIVEFRWAEGNYDRLPALAAELVRLDVDVLVTHSTAAVFAAQQATSTIPIVMTTSGDVVGSGLIARLNRPGRNVTGQTLFHPELNGKRLELLRDALPQINRVAVLYNANNPMTAAVLQEMAPTAAALKLELQQFEARRSGELASLFSAMVTRH
jgi:putative ABC transport system substrate-binding protein